MEVAVVAEAGERVGEGEPHRLQRAEGRALVERDREQRADERDREHGRALPEHDEDQRRRAHQRERHDRRAQRRRRPSARTAASELAQTAAVVSRMFGEEERDGTGGDRGRPSAKLPVSEHARSPRPRRRAPRARTWPRCRRPGCRGRCSQDLAIAVATETTISTPVAQPNRSIAATPNTNISETPVASTPSSGTGKRCATAEATRSATMPISSVGAVRRSRTRKPPRQDHSQAPDRIRGR